MGTTYRVQVAQELEDDRRAAVNAAIERELALVDRLLSGWRPDSEVARLNGHRAPAPFPLSPETLEVLVEAERVAVATDGAFDVTVGPLVAANGFGSHPAARPPSASELAALRRRVGWRLLALDPIQGTATKGHPELEVDLDGIAPGYAVDRIAAALEELGLLDYLVEIGGEVRASGRSAEDEVWRVGIERPVAEPGELVTSVPLDGMAAATSGDYRSFRLVDGARLTHILDPRSGLPLAHALASATVLHERCMTADALATALMVLGPEEALVLAEREGLAVLLLVRDGQGGFTERRSSAFEALAAGD